MVEISHNIFKKLLYESKITSETLWVEQNEASAKDIKFLCFVSDCMNINSSGTAMPKNST
jgi:hypothetical protein